MFISVECDGQSKPADECERKKCGGKKRPHNLSDDDTEPCNKSFRSTKSFVDLGEKFTYMGRHMYCVVHYISVVCKRI